MFCFQFQTHMDFCEKDFEPMALFSCIKPFLWSFNVLCDVM